MTLSDFFRLCKRSWKHIVAAVAFLGVLGCLFALTKPVEYKVEGTFREKNTKPSNLGNSLTMLVTGFGSNVDSEAFAIIRSRKLMSSVVYKLGLQGTVIQEGNEDTYFNRIGNHLKVEYALFRNMLRPILPNITCPMKINEIQYFAESPLVFQLQFSDSEDGYQVIDSERKILGQGYLGSPFRTDNFQFTLNCTDNKPKARAYTVVLWPMDLQAQNILDKLQIEPDRADKTLLRISYRDRNRHLARDVVNTIMESYQEYLKNVHDLQAELQMAYLKERQDETNKDLQILMDKYATSISEDLSSTGIANSDKEMNFLAESQHLLKEKLLANELESKRLQNLQAGSFEYYERYSNNEGDPIIINNILDGIRKSKQQRDSLELAITKSALFNSKEIQSSFNQQQQELLEVRKNLEELNSISDAYKNNTKPDFSLAIFDDKRFLLKAWTNSLKEIERSTIENAKKQKEHFLFYLENLKRLFNVHEKIIQERLTHQQNPSLEFQGIHLETSQELYIGYSKELNSLHSTIVQNHFLIKQVENPEFEISSLSHSLTDNVSKEIISRASQLSLELRDENNRTSKEQGRVQSELALQRKFLVLHLQQMTLLNELEAKLMEEKIYSLQNVTLELIHHQISLLEKNLKDYISTRLENLKQEKQIVLQHLDELAEKMSHLPKRWVQESLIEQNVETSQSIVQEIAKMVEVRNISHKLELIQSAPVDTASLPLHPLPSNMVLYTILGGMLGCISSMGLLVGRAIRNGVIASSSNLKSMGQNVAGNLSSNMYGPLKDQDLDTLRLLQSHLMQERGKQSLLLIEGHGPDYSKDLAELIVKKKNNVIRLFLDFDRHSQSDRSGLLQYLEGKTPSPLIQQDDGGDFIEGGGISRFSIEILRTQQFSDLLFKLKEKYDCILAVTHVLPNSAEGEILTSLFSSIAISVENETIPELSHYFKLATECDKKIAFVMVSHDDV